ncbi:hypothetical protein [Catellatospora citrea]|uniref:Uncharacterized protein n=1 Tax=Catellatospora citrea TaxID=53366 RepID=A0A8J3NYT8_9ACTN|nr:hypothetical protein [Catellatospora citrea]RKE05730.1 hypothetical protein C8E86_0540 [Catellatospora citrea]GIF97091.1 hypothetical protein Cci01nite_21850 [Catellatospora citrea]
MTTTASIIAQRLPDLAEYQLHRTADEAALEGVAVPGLAACFYRRELPGGRLASVGHYTLDGRDLLMAWGYVDEEHCRFHTVSGDGGWGPVDDGCPRVDVVRDGERVVGLRLQTAVGSWTGHTAAARRS